VFRGLGTSYLLDNKIAIMKGYTGAEIKKIYDELFMRAEILEYMIALGILEYDDVLDYVLYVQGVGIEQAHGRLRRQALMKLGHGIEQEVKNKVGGES
jgi:flagellar protein FlaI